MVNESVRSHNQEIIPAKKLQAFKKQMSEQLGDALEGVGLDKIRLFNMDKEVQILGKPGKKFVVIQYGQNAILLNHKTGRMLNDCVVLPEEGFVEGVDDEILVSVTNRPEGTHRNLKGLDSDDFVLDEFYPKVYKEIYNGFGGDKWMMVQDEEGNTGLYSLKYKNFVLPKFERGFYQVQKKDNTIIVSVTYPRPEDRKLITEKYEVVRGAGNMLVNKLQ